MRGDGISLDVQLCGHIETPAVDPGPKRPWLWLDDRKAAGEATRYLLSLGHRTVHSLAIPSSSRTR